MHAQFPAHRFRVNSFRSRHLTVCGFVVAWLIGLGNPRIVSAQEAPAAGLVQINLQGDVKLDVFVTYLSKRLGLKFLYDTDISNRSVTVRTPAEVPVESLMTLLGSVLRSEGLAIVDSEVDGWKRIVDVSEIGLYASQEDAGAVLARDGAAAPVTQVFVLEHLQATSLANVIKPLLTPKSSQTVTLAETNTLVVTDYSVNVARLSKLIEMIDRPAGEVVFEFYDVKHQSSETLAEQVQSVLSEATSAAPKPAASRTQAVQLINEPYGNRIIAAGDPALVKQALDLLQRLDVSLDVRTRAYRLRNLTAERLDTVVQGFLPPQDKERAYSSTIDEDGNLLVVRTTDSIHRQIETLIRQLDRPVETEDSPLRFYKLKNASAVDVLYSLLALQDAYGSGQAYGAGVPYGVVSPFGGVPVVPGGAFPGIGGGLNLGVPTTPGQVPGQSLTTTRLPLAPGENGVDGRSDQIVNNENPLASPLANSFGGLQAGGFGGTASLPGGARVSADPTTNSIIVVAPASVQPMYAKLIESLDQRRPQVLIEAKIVAINTTDNYSLGVEVSAGDRTGASRLFEFTSFGLSQVDPITGALTVIPSLGFNGTLVDPDVADVVVQALAQHTRAKVLAAPKILVNDNSTGKLESTVSIPFASVNASETVSTTSLGGDQQAGTIITVTPHINEDNHLQLVFDVEFSSFEGAGVANLPPPRQIDRVGSTVTIPDGQTIIVGGLKRVSQTDSFTGVPLLERIPIIRELSSLSSENGATTSFFLFIRPMILRDSLFRDLKFYSGQETRSAGIPGEFPNSAPLLMR